MKKEFPVSGRLANADLIPDKEQKWGWYSIFAFWMSDVHSVGGYVFAAILSTEARHWAETIAPPLIDSAPKVPQKTSFFRA
ncbi:hypothetical protein [Vibrio furnissii]|uniref:hypothetical protein n=1 Tax=Vibrio furnissii TaxID=29494 RepID=UPI001EEBE071|nr:hypothetical protein [Vibrio furnissii]